MRLSPAFKSVIIYTSQTIFSASRAMDFIPIDLEQKLIAVSNDAMSIDFRAYTVAQWVTRLSPEDPA